MDDIDEVLSLRFALDDTKEATTLDRVQVVHIFQNRLFEWQLMKLAPKFRRRQCQPELG